MLNEYDMEIELKNRPAIAFKNLANWIKEKLKISTVVVTSDNIIRKLNGDNYKKVFESIDLTLLFPSDDFHFDYNIQEINQVSDLKIFNLLFNIPIILFKSFGKTYIMK